MDECARHSICCSGPAVVSGLPCSICHSFGVEDKHTDENDSDHKTFFCLDLSPFFFPPKQSLLLFLFFSWCLFSFWEITEVTNRDFHSIVYVHISCLFKHIYLGTTWTKFQTPATSPQLNFTLFKHTLCCLSDVANLHQTPTEDSDLFECICCASVFDFCWFDKWKL